MVISMKNAKICKQCGAVKSLSEFYTMSRKNKENKRIKFKAGKCKHCHAFNCSLYYIKNREAVLKTYRKYLNSNYDKHRKCCKRWIKKNKWVFSYSYHKQNAKRKNLPFQLNSKDVKEIFRSPKRCSLTGKKLKFNSKRPKSDSPCLCRNDFNKGYDKNSVKLISFGEVVKKVATYNKNRRKKNG